jgi:hypothetical protein
MVMPPSEMTNAEIGLAFDELLIELRSLTEEAARRLANAPDAKTSASSPRPSSLPRWQHDASGTEQGESAGRIMARTVAIGTQKGGREKPRSQLTWLSHGPRPAVSRCGVPRRLPHEYRSSKTQHVTTRRTGNRVSNRSHFFSKDHYRSRFE